MRFGRTVFWLGSKQHRFSQPLISVNNFNFPLIHLLSRFSSGEGQDPLPLIFPFAGSTCAVRYVLRLSRFAMLGHFATIGSLLLAH